MYDKNTQAFIDHVKRECKKYGIKASLRNTKYVKLSGNIKCSGYFDDDNRMLVCSMNRPDFLEILAHEYCHLTQYIDQIDLWASTTISMPILDSWLSGEEVEDIDQHISNCRDLELDNEKRSVSVIKKFKLNIDIDHYIKKANAYVQFYNYMKYSRRWCTPERSPYTNENIILAMPNKFNMDYTKIPQKIKKLFIQEKI